MNKEAKRLLMVVWNETELENTTYLKYLGVTLDKLQQPTDEISNFQVGRKSKYYPNDSFSMQLLYDWVCSSSLGKITPCQKPGPRTKLGMTISRKMPKANQCWILVFVFGNSLSCYQKRCMLLLFAFQSMFISIWVSRLQIAEFLDSVSRVSWANEEMLDIMRRCAAVCTDVEVGILLDSALVRAQESTISRS